MKRVIYLFMAIMFCVISFCGCITENTIKSKMQEKVGVNNEVYGSYDDRLAAKCNNGTFIGQIDGNVLSYKGIPYAEPPVGELRWKAPVLAPAREGIYEARYFGKSPIQTEWPSEDGSYYIKGEDCLNLNVWINVERPIDDKTVMVFFHGGSYGWGATSDPAYDAHNLVEKYPDIVFVTVEYRVGIMGFIDFSNVPGGENFSNSGNLGLLDQICALQWIQQNIKSFGGNPGNVTILGESAGAGSVSLLPLIDGTKGLFQRIIAESGSLSLTFSREECKNLTNMLLERSACSNMDELMLLSEETLMDLNQELNDSNNFPERDGIVLSEDLYSAWANEKLSDIDILIGTNADETRYWIGEMGYYVPVFSGIFWYKLLMPFVYENNLKVMSPEEKNLVETFMNMRDEEKIWKLTEFYNELIFRIPAIEQAVRHKGRSYNYYWNMSGADETLGAFHSIELDYIFNDPQDGIYLGGLYNEELADVVQNMWVNFARCGDPSTDKYNWDPYTNESRKTMVLGKEIGMVEDLKHDQRELIEPLLYHYFNGNYSQLDYNVPQLYRIIANLVLMLGIILFVIILIIVIIRKNRKRKK